MESGDFINLDSPLTKYQIHDGQISRTSRLEKVETRVRLIWLRKNLFSRRESIGFKLLFILRLFDLMLSFFGFSYHRSLIRNYLK